MQFLNARLALPNRNLAPNEKVVELQISQCRQFPLSCGTEGEGLGGRAEVKSHECQVIY